MLAFASASSVKANKRRLRAAPAQQSLDQVFFQLPCRQASSPQRGLITLELDRDGVLTDHLSHWRSTSKVINGYVVKIVAKVCIASIRNTNRIVAIWSVS